MLKTKTFYIYKTDGNLDIQTFPFAFGELEERTRALFFDAQDDIELAGLDIDSLEEDEEYRVSLNEFLEHMENAEDEDEALADYGLDELEIDFVLSGETVVGYVLPDAQDPEITYVAAFLPIAQLKDILVGVPAKQISDLPLVRNRRKGGMN